MLLEKDSYREGSARYSGLLNVIASCPIFSGSGRLGELVASDRFSLCSYVSGETVYDKENFSKALGIVIKGRAMIYKGKKEREVLIGEQCRGGVFGAAALFGSFDRYASRIVAKGKQTIIAFIPQDLVKEMIISEPEVGIRYISFLSDRIRYLNKRLDIYTGKTPAERVIEYLKLCGGSVEDSMQKLSKELDVPRATLYRTAEKLESEGIISRNGKNMILKNDNIKR